MMASCKYKQFNFCMCMIIIICLPTDCSRPCTVSPDTVFHGNILDCSGRGITSRDISNLNFSNITILILNYNDIVTFQSSPFKRFEQLKVLECKMCNLNALDVDAFKGLRQLNSLVLSRNRLVITNNAFPYGVFHHTPYLKSLQIDDNENYGYASNYSEFIDIFDVLPELTNLAIDSFSNLIIGNEFTNLKYLESLKIYCKYLEKINNDSLIGLYDSSVKHLYLASHPLPYLYDKEDCDMLFQNLPNISTLKIEKMSFGNFKLLRMLQPLQGKHLDLLHLDMVGMYDTSREKKSRIYDRMITADMVQFLKHVCVSHFVWLNSYALMIDLDELTKYKWRNCLKSFTFVTGGTSVIADNVYIFQLFRLRRIESFVYMTNIKEQENDFWRKDTKTNGVIMDNTFFNETSILLNEEAHFQSKDLRKIASNNKPSYDIDSPWQNRSLLGSRRNRIPFLHEGSFHRFGYDIFYWYIPPMLNSLILDNAIQFLIKVDILVTKNILKSLTMRNARRGIQLNARLIGFDELLTIDFTGSEVSGQSIIFKGFPKLQKVLLKRTQQNSKFFFEVVENVPALEYFDISDNGLQWLPNKIFHSNRNLKYLCLASNHFGILPFDLEFTPRLEILDLRKNSIVLTRNDLQSIDNHLHYVRNFSLLLSDNQVSCACSALPFLRWLHTTTVHFDNEGNYVCMTEGGTLSNTSSFVDVEALWRQCNGKLYLLASLVLMSTLMTGYMATFLVMKHKTYIISKAMQIVGYPMKTREDFSLDVFIGYADQDVEFVRGVLLRYLEDMWHLRTFVHQRDILQDPLMMSRAIGDSWRKLLLITENFLDHFEMAHNIMKVCTFFVHPTNPRNVIVIVEENVLHRIPDYVLQVVDEDNIIVLPSLTEWLDYKAKETLKTRIF